MHNPRILFSTPGTATFIPPLQLSEKQVVAGFSYTDIPDQTGGFETLQVKAEYNAAELVARLPTHQQPDLFVAIVDGAMTCVPRNLAQLSCRKVLLIADTHYAKMPLSHLLSYCQQEKYDRYAVLYDPHHMHWFSELGISPLALHPNLNVQDVNLPLVADRQSRIVFVGSKNPIHQRRMSMLDAIRNSGLESFITTVDTSQEAAAIYAGSALTLNCSLNGDFNMRIFEALSAGACLLTDRLSPQSCLERFFEDGKHLIIYDSADDLVRKAKHYLERPEQCFEIAKMGHARYLEIMSEDKRRQSFLAFCFADDAKAKQMCEESLPFDQRNRRPVLKPEALLKRAWIYEDLQEMHRREMLNFVYCHDSIRREVRDDLADLPHLTVSSAFKNGKKSCLVIQDSACLKFLAEARTAPSEYIYVVMGKESEAAIAAELSKLGYISGSVWQESKNPLFTAKAQGF